ncbi:hypothetical protein PCANC_16519 [Puccinia coronata f. sp. avenae]|uniref:Uncharacterized protein n=1 Tax=Puccinia coronata f. sp. avenae TaxID=200324 RepID=A0A2N5SR78_9BASI|nr:hypothetical protein PCANC_16519 [Puccinia coronata f. sp. avenae]
MEGPIKDANMVKEGTQVSKSTTSDSVGTTGDTMKTGRFDFFSNPIQKDREEQLHPGQESSRLVWKNNLDKKVDDFMKTPSVHNDLEKVDATLDLSPEEKAAELKKSLHKLHAIRQEDIKTARMMLMTDSDLSEKIEAMLLRLDQDLHPLPVLARWIARYQAKSLAEDQKILSNSLPSERRYLSTVHGCMGPKNVLERWYQETIQEKVQTNELQLHGKEAEFLSELKRIQVNLAHLAISQQTDHPSTASKALALRNNERIQKNEDKLVGIVGNRDELKKTLKLLENMDYHKRFMKELKSPRSSYHFDLQFIEPFDRRLEDLYAPSAEAKIPIYDKIGIKSEPHHIRTIEQQATPALNNFLTYLDIYLKLREEERRILNIITPQDLASLSMGSIPKQDHAVKKNPDVATGR